MHSASFDWRIPSEAPKPQSSSRWLDLVIRRRQISKRGSNLHLKCAHSVHTALQTVAHLCFRHIDRSAGEDNVARTIPNSGK